MKNELNGLLADLVVEYHKLQSFHWYLKGHHFFVGHPKLEEYYDEISEAIDEVAENMLMCEYAPESTMKGFLEITTIEEGKNEEVVPKDVYEAVLADFTNLLNRVKSIKALADEEDNYLISALMDTYIAQFSKNIWMVKQELKN